MSIWNVSLCEDLRAGKSVGGEAAAVIEQYEAELAAKTAECERLKAELLDDRVALQCSKAENIKLLAERKKMEAQEPFCWTSGKKFDGELETDDTQHDGWFPLYDRPVPAVPESWQLVPKEPTEEMIDAAIKNGAEGDENIRDYVTSDYKAMLAAAPKEEA